METSEYVSLYLGALPEQLRPDKEVPRLNTALVKAKRNGWQPKALAKAVVNNTDWATVGSPVGLMVHKAEKMAATKIASVSTAPALKFVDCPHGEPKGANYCALCRRGIK